MYSQSPEFTEGGEITADDFIMVFEQAEDFGTEENYLPARFYF